MTVSFENLALAQRMDRVCLLYARRAPGSGSNLIQGGRSPKLDGQGKQQTMSLPCFAEEGSWLWVCFMVGHPFH